MKQKLLIIAAAILIVSNGCSKKTLPSLSSSIKDYDSAAFNYIYAEAIRQKLLGNPAEALKYLEQCIEANPQSDASYHQMAMISLQLGNVNNAKKYALKATAADEKNLWYLTFLSGIYYQEKNLDSSIIFYERAVKLFPEKNNLKLTLGNMYSEQGEYKKANEIYRFLEERYGTAENITVAYVRSLMNAGEYKTAEEKILRLIADNPSEILYNGMLAEIYARQGNSEKASEIYSKLLELDSTNPQTLLSLADFMLKEKQYDYLIRLLNSIAINEKVSLESKVTLLAGLLDNNNFLEEKKSEFEVSLMIFESSEKNKDVINMIRPEFYQKTGQIAMAIERLEDIISESPENYYAWEKLLFMYSEAGEYDKLLQKGKECATKFNMSYIAKVLYASAAIEKGKYDIAEEELRKAKILAGSQNELLVQVQTMEADMYYRKGEYEKSFAIFREAVMNNPNDLVILNNYAYYLAEQNRDLKEAEKMIKIVIEKDKTNSTFLDTYAWVLFKKGNKREAIKVMDEIMQREKKGDPEWYEHYGFMMKSIKRCDLAVEYWNKAIEMDPEKSDLLKEIENCKN